MLPLLALQHPDRRLTEEMFSGDRADPEVSLAINSIDRTIARQRGVQPTETGIAALCVVFGVFAAGLVCRLRISAAFFQCNAVHKLV
jgi:hypothetical protein